MLQVFNVPAGGRQINARGSWFRVESVAAILDQSVRVSADGQDLGTYLPGDAVTLPIDAKTWNVAPVDPAATAVVRIGVGSVQSSRLVGTVRVEDELALASAKGNQFWGSQTAIGGATSMPFVCLAPSAGKKLSVRRIFVTSPTAGAFRIGAWNVGTTDPGLTIAPGQALPSMKLGGAGSGARFHSGQIESASWAYVLALGGAEWFMDTYYLGANGLGGLLFEVPLVVDSTKGLMVTTDIANKQLTVTAQFAEL